MALLQPLQSPLPVIEKVSYFYKVLELPNTLQSSILHQPTAQMLIKGKKSDKLLSLEHKSRSFKTLIMLFIWQRHCCHLDLLVQPPWPTAAHTQNPMEYSKHLLLAQGSMGLTTCPHPPCSNRICHSQIMLNIPSPKVFLSVGKEALSSGHCH